MNSDSTAFYAGAVIVSSITSSISLRFSPFATLYQICSSSGLEALEFCGGVGISFVTSFVSSSFRNMAFVRSVADMCLDIVFFFIISFGIP